MRAARFPRVLTLASLGVAVFVVSVYFSTNRHSNARSVQEPPRLPTVRSTLQGDGDRVIPGAAGKAIPSAASYTGNQPLVVADGDAEIIVASVAARDDRPNLGYVWAVHVFMPEDTGYKFAVFEHWFESQPIEVKPGASSATHTLWERLPIPLPFGRYRVLVGAYRIEPDGGLEGLKAKPAARFARSLEGPSGWIMATIGR